MKKNKSENKMVNRAIALLLTHEPAHETDPDLDTKTVAKAFGVKPMRVAAIKAHITMGNQVGR